MGNRLTTSRDKFSKWLLGATLLCCLFCFSGYQHEATSFRQKTAQTELIISASAQRKTNSFKKFQLNSGISFTRAFCFESRIAVLLSAHARFQKIKFNCNLAELLSFNRPAAAFIALHTPRKGDLISIPHFRG